MPTETHAARAYQYLRDRLISGDFQPGTRLLYGPIGKEIGVSATPVREAAGQLANEGLVELVPQRGAVVRRIDRQELEHIYEVRLAIEPFAAQLAAVRASSDQLKRISADLDRMTQLTERQSASGNRFADKRTTASFDKADYSFHLHIIEATANPAMIRTASQSHVLTRVFGIRRHQYDASSMKATCQEHRAILKAIQQHDAESASKAASTHIRNGLAKSIAAANNTGR